MSKIKIWFFGTPELAREVLADIFADNRFEIAFVVTNPDKTFGRKQELISSPVKIFAQEKNINIFQPEKIRNNIEFLNEISTYNCDYFVVVAYGKILPNDILEMPKKMCINVHGSILPAYRGASPIQSALLNGEKETGVTIMQMSEWMDEGDMILVKKIIIDENETSSSLFEKFWQISWKALIDGIIGLENGELTPIPQDHKSATYCTKITKEDGEIDWNISGEKIFQKFQAYTPWPGIFTYFNGKRIIFEKIFFQKSEVQNPKNTLPKIFREKNEAWILFSDGKIIIESIKPEGKKSQKFADFLNGNPGFLEVGFDGFL